MLLKTQTQAASALPGVQIPRLGHEEAYQMALAELQNFLDLLEDLHEEDWSKPTACALWNVRQMVAHVVGAEEGYLSFKNFKRQLASKELKRYAGQGLKGIDATNQLQVDDRADRTPRELIAELRAFGPRSIYNRYKLPGWLRTIPAPLPVLGLVRVGYLTDLIYTRDMWMHRLDICRATGREMILKPEHDRRMTALVVRDLAKRNGGKLKDISVTFNLTGPAGGSWLIGNAPVSAATVEMDALGFQLLAAGRLSPQALIDQNLVTITGNYRGGRAALENALVPY